MYGVVEINGKKYIERPQEFVFSTTFTVALSTQLNQNLVLPGVADFWLKELKRQVIAAGAPATNNFKFRLGNTDGGIWYVSAGNGGTNDRVVDTLFFGTGQFPKVFTPPILYSASASIKMEFEDISNAVPYTINISFGGSYLFPFQG